MIKTAPAAKSRGAVVSEVVKFEFGGDKITNFFDGGVKKLGRKNGADQ